MAVNTSTEQMALTRDLGPAGFMERVTAILTLVARGVLSESEQTPYHSGRASYAQRVIANPLAAAMAGGSMIVMGVNIIQKTTYDEPTQTATCTATDPELESQITTFYNALGGLDTPAT